MRLGPIDLREEVEDFYVGHTIGAALDALLHQVCLELQYAGRMIRRCWLTRSSAPSASCASSAPSCPRCARRWTWT